MSTCEIPQSSFSKRSVRAIVAIVIVAILASWFLPSVQRIMPALSGTAAFGSVIILGLVASVSTCLATTGGFILAYVAESPSRKRVALVHIGRMAAFVIGGSLLGALGGAVPSWSPTWYGLLTIIMGIGFLGVALQLFDIAPSWASLGIAAPESLRRLSDRVRHGSGPLAPFLVGSATFILPCGFTQTAQGLALVSGSAFNGGILMFAFALGTLPMLLGLTTFASKAKLSHPYMRIFAGAMLFLFAVGQLESAATIFGMGLPNVSASPAVVANTDVTEQTVDMIVSAFEYKPASFTVKKGVPVHWQIYARESSGCTSTLISRELGINKKLIRGMNDITFVAKRTGTIAFSCGMGMVKGSINVIN